MMRPRSSRDLAGASRPDLAEIRSWLGWRVDDVHGSGIGRLEDVIPDELERDADWLVVNEFRFGEGRRFLVPAADATGSGGRVWVPYDREFVRGSAGLGSARHTPQAERRLRAYYFSSRDQVA